MEMPLALRQALENQAEALSQAELIRQAQALSARYRDQRGAGKALVTGQEQALAYAVARMPATFAAVAHALQQTLAACPTLPQTLLDVGAGTGAASWAADQLLSLESLCCLEREPAMGSLGQTLMTTGSPALQQAQWVFRDILHGLENRKADLVISAYMLNELRETDRLQAATALWAAADQILLLVEPGTPTGHQNLMKIRQSLLAQGAHILAPCPSPAPCPLDANDWCHCIRRVSRSKLHQRAKGGEAPYEDEKFAYLALAKAPGKPAQARILRHPLIHKGHVRLSLCTGKGVVQEVVTSKDKEAYKKARKAGQGDGWGEDGGTASGGPLS